MSVARIAGQRTLINANKEIIEKQIQDILDKERKKPI